jgi:glutaconate CoA-transferase subunit B
MMALMAAKELKDGEIAFVGIGLSLAAGIVAQNLHAPNLTIVYESGCIGPRKRRTDFNVGDSSAADEAMALTSEWRVFGDLQAGFYDVGVLGAAQVDRFGNLNSTAIFGQGDYRRPRVRLPGSGGANDIGSSAGRIVILTKMEEGRFVPRVDYLTTPGYLDGSPGARRKAGLLGGGPVAVVTDKAVLRFCPDTREMYLDTVYPEVAVEEIKKYFPWDLRVAPEVKVAPLPGVEELEAIRRADPAGLLLGGEEAWREIGDLGRYVGVVLAAAQREPW